MEQRNEKADENQLPPPRPLTPQEIGAVAGGPSIVNGAEDDSGGS